MANPATLRARLIRCGALHIGDHLLSIDDANVEDMSVTEATQLLKYNASDVVRLEIQPMHKGLGEIPSIFCLEYPSCTFFLLIGYGWPPESQIHMIGQCFQPMVPWASSPVPVWPASPVSSPVAPALPSPLRLVLPSWIPDSLPPTQEVFAASDLLRLGPLDGTADRDALQTVSLAFLDLGTNTCTMNCSNFQSTPTVHFSTH